MDQWAELALRLQRDIDSVVSRLGVATVIAEVRRELRAAGEEDSLELVGMVASERVADMAARRHQASSFTLY